MRKQNLIDQTLDHQLQTYEIFNGPGGGELMALLLNRHQWMGLNPRPMQELARFQADEIATAPSYCVTSDMEMLVESGVQHLDEEGICPVLRFKELPTRSGFVILESAFPMPTTTRDLAVTPVRGFWWQASDVYVPGDEQTRRLGLMSGTLVEARHAMGDLPHGWPADRLLPFDVTGWTANYEWEVVDHDTYFDLHTRGDSDFAGKVHPSGAQWRRWLYAFWSLCNQRIGHGRASRHARRRFMRVIPAPAPNFGDVRIITLRRYTMGDTGMGEPTYTKEWSHRWVVNGHWRWQPHGPGRKERKLIWIPPFIKGPDNKPLIVRDDVRVVRR